LEEALDLPFDRLLKMIREIIAVFSEIHTKHINKLCGKNVELMNVESGGI